ncbi:30S ribosome-binding factor RbfA [Spiroplasma endosymbiont of Aspidapion aeneum]|uniref:30S ribosome-binding factor RbfA n=1 Tax=Spiroplasma endosymbiont of Aspidapion aeneum TaxID=3066276 RepID=UPI00313DE78C
MLKDIERLQSTILRDVNIILQKEIKNNHDFLLRVNVVEVRLSKDKSHAKIYYTILLDEDHDIKTYEKILSDNLKEIRMLLAKKINVKSVPNLEFVYDQWTDSAENIEKILSDIKKKQGDDN